MPLNIPEILRGDPTPQIQTETWDYDPTRGWMHYFDFEGISPNQMAAKQLDYVRDGIACRLVYKLGGNARLDVSDATLSYTIDTWEIVANEENRDGLSNPILAVALQNASLDVDKVIASTRKHLEVPDDPTALFGTGGDFDGAPDTLKRYYSLQLRGSTDYRREQYVLRHRTNAPARYSANVADNGINQIYTTAELLSECTNPALWILPLPGRLQYKISNIPVPTYQANYLWGWLKGASTETTAPNNRIDIATEYCLEQWSTDYYPPY